MILAKGFFSSESKIWELTFNFKSSGFSFIRMRIKLVSAKLLILFSVVNRLELEQEKIKNDRITISGNNIKLDLLFFRFDIEWGKKYT